MGAILTNIIAKLLEIPIIPIIYTAKVAVIQLEAIILAKYVANHF